MRNGEPGDKRQVIPVQCASLVDPIERALLVYLIQEMPSLGDLDHFNNVGASIRAVFDRDLSVPRFIGHHCEKPYIDHGNVGASCSKTVATPAHQPSSEPIP